MDLLFFVFIALILLVVIITEDREKKKVKAHRNEETYNHDILIDCNIRKDNAKIRDEE